MRQKVKYFFDSAFKIIKQTGLSCPSCGASDTELVSKKYFVTSLKRCKACYLLFRSPTTSKEENASFYQEEYSQGFTTDLPSDDILNNYLANAFLGSDKDYSTYIDILKVSVGVGKKIFDFGCSWGYGSWQLMNSGYDVDAYEISLPRADYARKKLNINVFTNLIDVRGQYDVFFSSHVLEHVPSVEASIDFGMNLLKPGGLFIAFTPNGSEQHKKRNSRSWNGLWGLVHPNFLDEVFYCKFFTGKKILVASNPYCVEEIALWSSTDRQRKIIADCGGSELMVLAVK